MTMFTQLFVAWEDVNTYAVLLAESGFFGNLRTWFGCARGAEPQYTMYVKTELMKGALPCTCSWNKRQDLNITINFALKVGEILNNIYDRCSSIINTV